MISKKRRRIYKKRTYNKRRTYKKRRTHKRKISRRKYRTKKYKKKILKGGECSHRKWDFGCWLNCDYKNFALKIAAEC